MRKEQDVPYFSMRDVLKRVDELFQELSPERKFFFETKFNRERRKFMARKRADNSPVGLKSIPRKPVGGAFGEYVRRDFQKLLASPSRKGLGKDGTAKLALQRWQCLPRKDKENLAKEAVRKMKVYQMARARILKKVKKKTHGLYQRTLLMNYQKARAKILKKMKKNTRPAIPVGGAFGVFLHEQRPKILASGKVVGKGGVAKRASELWQNMTSSQKRLIGRPSRREWRHTRLQRGDQLILTLRSTSCFSYSIVSSLQLGSPFVRQSFMVRLICS